MLLLASVLVHISMNHSQLLTTMFLSSVLFLIRDNSPQVFETFGQVSSPFYSVRYNCRSDVERLGLEPGQTVFYAPSETQYTYYIFLDQLIRSVSLKTLIFAWQ